MILILFAFLVVSALLFWLSAKHKDDIGPVLFVAGACCVVLAFILALGQITHQ